MISYYIYCTNLAYQISIYPHIPRNMIIVITVMPWDKHFYNFILFTSV